MIKYNYQARDKSGQLKTGEIEAEDSKIAAHKLLQSGLTPLKVDELENKISFALIEKIVASWQKVKSEDIIVFTRQLASVLEAGVPLLEGLDAVQEQVKNKRFKAVLVGIKRDIEGGSSLSIALEKYKDVFPLFLINMVKAGEKAGILDDVLDRISNLLEKELETAELIKAATRYPTIVLATLAIAFVILTTFVIPKFSAFFGSFGADLPLPTMILVMINNYISAYWHFTLMGLVLFVFGLRAILKTEKGHYNWHKIILKIPIFGPLYLRIFLSRFARMLSAMLASGIPILDALSISATTVENVIITEVVFKIKDEVAAGSNLAKPMRSSKLFPPLAVSMVAIGEKAGSLEKMLNKVADYFDREANYTIKNLTPLLEPILIFGLAAVMLLFALGIFLPMWDLIKVYKTY